ncbi:MAG: hypothetical protein IT383_04240 [Deltaproteobacteria bacterium]|nr:hypothetical protein [Deltaproteobacteria bacterium]
MKTLRNLAVLAALFSALLAAAPADAHQRRGHRQRPRGVPELDGSSAASAAVLLGAGVFVILGSRRRRLKP